MCFECLKSSSSVPGRHIHLLFFFSFASVYVCVRVCAEVCCEDVAFSSFFVVVILVEKNN